MPMTATCRRGHVRTPENTRIQANGKIRCLACNRISRKNPRPKRPEGYCYHGHALTPDNLLPPNRCRECARISSAKKHAARRERLGIAPRTRKPKAPKPPPVARADPLTTIDLAAVVRGVADGSISVPKLAKEHRIGHSRLLRALRNCEGWAEAATAARRLHIAQIQKAGALATRYASEFWRDRDAEVIGFVADDHSVVKIAEKMGLTPGQVSGRLFRLREWGKLGPPRPQKPRVRAPKKPSLTHVSVPIRVKPKNQIRWDQPQMTTSPHRLFDPAHKVPDGPEKPKNAVPCPECDNGSLPFYAEHGTAFVLACHHCAGRAWVPAGQAA